MVLWPYSIHGLGYLGKYNSRPSITYEGNQGYCIIKIKSLYLHIEIKILLINKILKLGTH